jgi:UDP-N-acetyl-2-amino-2-deoxyglucuronate dehydrogenase
VTGPLRFAIIGAGEIGRVHADAIAGLAPRARLAVVVDRDPDRAGALAAEHLAEPVPTVAAALARPDVHAVAICTPSGSHAELAVASMDAGKHVVVEKPLDVTVEAARTVARAQDRTGRTVTVISQHRFDAASLFVRDHVRGGRLGRISSAVASIAWWRTQAYYDSGVWRGSWALDGGGALMNQGIHTLDLLIWLLGEPVEAFGWTGRLAHERIEVEDTAAATIRFASGALGVLLATTAAYPGVTARLQIHGDRGSAVIDDDRLTYFHAATDGSGVPTFGADATANQAATLLPADAEPRVSASADPSALLARGHTDQYRDFLDAVEHDRPPLVTVADAITNVAVIRAIYESAATGRPVTVRCSDRLPRPTA